MSTSLIAREIPTPATLALTEQARLLRLRGEPVIHLGAGEPKNPAPVTAVLGAAASLRSGDIKYTPTEGTPALRQAIIRYTEDNYGRHVAPENVLVSNGAKQAVWNTLFSILNPQDEVVVLAPYWVSYPAMARMMQAVPVIVHPEDGGFHPRMSDIEQALSSHTKAIIVNSPNNPSGAVYSADFIAELVALCEQRGIYYISDDIYHRLIFDGVTWTSPYACTDKSVDDSRVVCINGVSKIYGMTGFRIGWSVAPRALTEVMANVQAQVTSTASLVLQEACTSALLGMQSHVETLRLHLQNNRGVLLDELRSFSRPVRCDPPAGTFYCLVDFRAFDEDTTRLSRLILDKARVVTVPGAEFGAPGHLRLSICGPTRDIVQGLERIRWAIDPEAPNELYIGERKLVRDWM